MLGGRLPLSMDLRLGYFYFFRVKDRKENRATSYMQNRMCLTKSHFLNLQGTLPKKPIRCSSRQVFFCEAPGCRRGGRGLGGLARAWRGGRGPGGRGLGGLVRVWRGGRGPGGRGQALQSRRKAQAGHPRL